MSFSSLILTVLLCRLIGASALLQFRSCDSSPTSYVASCPFNTISQQQRGAAICCVDCKRFKNNATVRVYSADSARSLIGYATCPDPNRHSEKIAQVNAEGTQVILPLGTDVRACCLRVGPSNCYYSLPAVSSLVGSPSLSRLVEQVCKVTVRHVLPITPIAATASHQGWNGSPMESNAIVSETDSDSCGLRFVKSGEQIPTGVQRLFSAFQKASSPTFGKTQWLISPPARVGIAVVNSGADYWHPDFCNNCPLSQPLPPNMDTILHQGIAIIPTTDNSTLNPDPPPTQDDNGAGTWSTG